MYNEESLQINTTNTSIIPLRTSEIVVRQVALNSHSEEPHTDFLVHKEGRIGMTKVFESNGARETLKRSMCR